MSPSGCPSHEVLLCSVFSSCTYLHASLCTYLIAWYLRTYIAQCAALILTPLPTCQLLVNQVLPPQARMPPKQPPDRTSMLVSWTTLWLNPCVRVLLLSLTYNYFLCTSSVVTMYIHGSTSSQSHVRMYVHTYIFVCVYVRSWMWFPVFSVSVLVLYSMYIRTMHTYLDAVCSTVDSFLLMSNHKWIQGCYNLCYTQALYM